MSNLEKYRKVFEEVFCVDEAVLNENFTFKGVDAWDSITHMTLITELEDTFDIMLETEDIIHYGSYLNGIEILKKYGVDFA
jgi:acyl carrier protein